MCYRNSFTVWIYLKDTSSQQWFCLFNVDRFIFQNDVHANIGGGRDNIVSSNIMYEAEGWSMRVDGRWNADNQHHAYLTQKLHVISSNIYYCIV